MIHINKAFQFNPNGVSFHELTDFHPDIKPATYILVSRLLGASGCSNDGNLWDWSAMGIIHMDSGIMLISPTNWLIALEAGGKIILTDE